VDDRFALVTWANFTDRGQTRNIEAGVLVEDRAFASALAAQWRGLIESGLVHAHPVGRTVRADHRLHEIIRHHAGGAVIVVQVVGARAGDPGAVPGHGPLGPERPALPSRGGASYCGAMR
jgi:hypothetical protein